MNTATLVLSDQASPSPEKTEAITAFMFELMAKAEQQGDIEVALNAILGSYMNLAQKSRVISVRKSAAALVAAGKAMAAADELLQPKVPAREAQITSSAEGIDQARVVATNALIAKLNFQLQGQRHEDAISALLSLFRQAALEFTCCTKVSGEYCIALGRELLTSAAAGQREPGTPVH